MKFWIAACICMYVHMHVRACVPKNTNFDYWVNSTSNGHNSLNISPKQAQFVFKLKLKMSTFQCNKFHPSILYGSKVMVKKVSEDHFSASFSKQFEHF